MELVLFLAKVFIISFSGAMQPGPITATAITMGARNRWAGAFLVVGHGIVEFPLMILIMLGVGKIFESNTAQIIIGLAGGIVLLIMAVQMFIASAKRSESQAKISKDRPILAGMVLTVSNPYFLIWWATVGLALAMQAGQFGTWAFGMFTVTHWLVDLVWVSIISFAGFYGTKLMGARPQRIILIICAAAMLLFGLKFGYDAIFKLI